MRKIALSLAALLLAAAPDGAAQEQESELVSILVMKKKEEGEARGFLGVAVSPASEALAAQLGLPEGTGVVIDRVVPDSPAEKAGLERHDVILSVDDEPVASADQLRERIAAHAPGEEVRLVVVHRGQREELTVELTEAPVQPFEVEVLPAPEGGRALVRPFAHEEEEEEWEHDEGARRMLDEMRERWRAFRERAPRRHELADRMRRALEESRERIAQLQEELAHRGIDRERLARLARELAEDAQRQLRELRESLDEQQLDRVREALQRMVDRVRAFAEGRPDRPAFERLDERMCRLEERMERIERLLERRLSAPQREAAQEETEKQGG